MKLFILLTLFMMKSAFAQDTRWIDIEWEAVAEAREYQIELFQEVQGQNVPRGKYKTDSAEWSHAVQPGKYSLRLRSVDSRGVPGEWSDYVPLKIKFKNPLMLRPVSGNTMEDPLTEFEWAPVLGAVQYQLIVRNEKNEILHNAVVKELKTSVYIESVGKIQWVVFALEKDEAPRTSDQWKDNAFRVFTRVPGTLEAPKVNLDVGAKVKFIWERVKLAQSYEVDYLPPPDSGQKNRRFRLKQSPLAFGAEKLREGTTTLTVRAMAPGQKESTKSIVKIYKSGSKVEIQDIIQGKEESEFKTAPNKTFFRNEILFAVTLAKFSYESENQEMDTRLDQKSLTGLGLFGEWNRRPALNSLNRKFEFALQQLSSGIDSGIAARLGYGYHKDKKLDKMIFHYGGGASFLMLPAFVGNRFINKVEVHSASSIGPELQLGVSRLISSLWEVSGAAIFAYHPIYLSSDLDGGQAFLWTKLQGRVQFYYTEKQAFFLQADYQQWTQEFSKASTSLSGMGVNLGIQTGF